MLCCLKESYDLKKHLTLKHSTTNISLSTIITLAAKKLDGKKNVLQLLLYVKNNS